MKKTYLFILIFGSLNLFANNATITVNPQKKSGWKVDKLLFGSFQEEHWGDLTPGIYEQYIVNPSFEKWKWGEKHLKTGIVFFEVQEDEDVAYPWEKAYTGPGITYSLSKKNPKNSQLCQHIVVTSGKKAGIKQQLALPDYRTLNYRYKFYIRKKGNVKVKVDIVSCIANKVKFDWPGLDGELFRNLTCIPSVCALISGRLYAKRDQPYKALVFGAQPPQNTTPMSSIAFRILRHLCIRNTIVKLHPIYDAGH